MTPTPGRLDRYTLALIATVALAVMLPCRGMVAAAFEVITPIAIAALFFLYGARLSRAAILSGLTHWRLHMLVLACTFVAFPLIGVAVAHGLPGGLVAPELVLGIVYLSVLPSTVQSSIAFTSIAGGNVAAAVCSASLSNLGGVFLTPLLVSLLLTGSSTGPDPGLSAIGAIVLQLFVPFGAGHLARPLIEAWLGRRRALLAVSDRGTVLLIVYVAFSASVVEGLWNTVPTLSLAVLVLVVVAVLACALILTTLLARRLGFAREDEVAIVFCGSKKSLASGIPMAKILFAGNPAIGMIVLPVLIYHQIQLMVCALIAQRYARGSSQFPTPA